MVGVQELRSQTPRPRPKRGGPETPKGWRKPCEGLSPPYPWAPPLSFLRSLPARGNLLPNLTAADMKTCHFHPDKAPFCPILRVGDVVKFAGQDFAKLASTVRT